MSAQLPPRLQFDMSVFLKHTRHCTHNVISQQRCMTLLCPWGHTKGFPDVVTAHVKRKVLWIIAASQEALFAPFAGGKAGAAACLLL